MRFNFSKFIQKAASVHDAELGYPLEDALDVFRFYFQTYENYLHRPHPMLKRDQVRALLEAMPEIELTRAGGQIANPTPEDYYVMIFRHFITRYGPSCDYNIIHFFSGRVRELRYLETCY